MNPETQTALDAISRPEMIEGLPVTPVRNGSPRTPVDSKERTRHIQELIEQIVKLPDIASRELAQECLQSVLAFYGDGLGRIIQLTKNAGAGGRQVLDALAHDNLVRGLLLIHGLHPVSLELRLGEALDKIRPYLQSHGGNVELLSLKDDVARLRLQGTCKTCPSSSATLELAVRQTIEEACPDLMGFEVEGVAPSTEARIPHGPDAPHWTILDEFKPMEAGEMCFREVEGVSVIVCNSRGNIYAYRNRCPVCNAALAGGTLAGDILRCPAGHRFDARHAGNCPDDPAIHLDPFPLLALNGIVKIAVKPEPNQNQKTNRSIES
jgi:Fe-S cluster biogenesis protein NfuA/nitrite reductase/ring-hydroxylating ferredoxin subunit